MYALEKAQANLKLLELERARIVTEGWYLQGCWLVQVKPGGTARTQRQYWQVRSRQQIFDGKTLKHIQSIEVKDYTDAIDRGRRLKQLDRAIRKLQQRIEKLLLITDPLSKFYSISSELIPS